MEYKRIDENTIRCIITEEDMENFGLDLDEFLTHSKKSDEFLRYIVEEARDELGYQTEHGVVSMRLEVLEDGRISLTFGSGNEKQMQELMLKHLRELTEKQVVREIERALERKKEELQKQSADAEELRDAFRIYQFASLKDVMSYCRAIGLKQPIRSHLYKEKEQYYLIVERYRISDYHFNLLTAVAFDYSKVTAGGDALYSHLKEHGELLLENRAIGILRKI